MKGGFRGLGNWVSCFWLQRGAKRPQAVLPGPSLDNSLRASCLTLQISSSQPLQALTCHCSHRGGKPIGIAALLKQHSPCKHVCILFHVSQPLARRLATHHDVNLLQETWPPRQPSLWSHEESSCAPPKSSSNSQTIGVLDETA